MVRGVGIRRSGNPQLTTLPSSATWGGPVADAIEFPASSSGGERRSPSAGSAHTPSSFASEHSVSEGHISQPEGSVESLGPWLAALLRQNSDATDNDIVEHRIPVGYNAFGKTIGEFSATFGTRVGKIARNTVSPHHVSWKKVPWVRKNEVWRCVQNEFLVPDALKAKTLTKASHAWRKSKQTLRQKCDKCSTVAELLAIIPAYIERDDWEKFVVMVSKEDDWVKRARGKKARKGVKAAHSTGRRGIASVRDEMEKASPTGTVTRSALFLATHEYQEISEQDLIDNFDPQSYEVTSRDLARQVRELNETEEYRNETNLDRDAVAKVLGTDGRGVVRGMGGGVSKTEVRASAAARELLREGKKKLQLWKIVSVLLRGSLRN